MTQNTTKTPGSSTERGEPEKTQRLEHPTPSPELVSELRIASAHLSSAAERLVSSATSLDQVKTIVEEHTARLQTISDALTSRLPSHLQAIAGQVKVMKATGPLRHEAVLAAVARMEQTVSQVAERSAERQKGLADASKQSVEEMRREARADHDTQKQVLDGVQRAVKSDIPSSLTLINQTVIDVARSTAEQSRTELRLLENIQEVISKDLPEKIATAQATLLSQIQEVVDTKVSASGHRTRVELARLKALVSQADQNLKRAERGLPGIAAKPSVDAEAGSNATSEIRIEQVASALSDDAHTKLVQAKKEVAEANELLSHISLQVAGAGKLDLSARERVALIFLATALVGFLVWVYGQVKISVVAADRERTTADVRRATEDARQCSERERLAAAKLANMAQQSSKLDSQLDAKVKELDAKVKELNDLTTKWKALQEQKTCRPVRSTVVPVPLLIPASGATQFPCYALDCRTVPLQPSPETHVRRVAQ